MSGVNLRALSRSFCSTRSTCEPFIWTKPYRPAAPATARSTSPPYATRSSTRSMPPATCTSPKADATTPDPPKPSTYTARYDKPGQSRNTPEP
jgi:hypothetical protein